MQFVRPKPTNERGLSDLTKRAHPKQCTFGSCLRYAAAMRVLALHWLQIWIQCRRLRYVRGCSFARRNAIGFFGLGCSFVWGAAAATQAHTLNADHRCAMPLSAPRNPLASCVMRAGVGVRAPVGAQTQWICPQAQREKASGCGAPTLKGAADQHQAMAHLPWGAAEEGIRLWRTYPQGRGGPAPGHGTPALGRGGGRHQAVAHLPPTGRRTSTRPWQPFPGARRKKASGCGAPTPNGAADQHQAMAHLHQA